MRSRQSRSGALGTALHVALCTPCALHICYTFVTHPYTTHHIRYTHNVYAMTQLRHHFANTTVWCGGWSGARAGLVDDLDSVSSKYPVYGPFFSARAHPRSVWYAGALMHGLDWRKSAGGFVHGFRYLIRAQARFMLARDYGGWRAPNASPAHDLRLTGRCSSI